MGKRKIDSLVLPEAAQRGRRWEEKEEHHRYDTVALIGGYHSMTVAKHMLWLCI
jgi:hypothetical protein